MRPSVNSSRRLLQFVSLRYCAWVQNPVSAAESATLQAVGGDHTQSGGLGGGGRHVPACFCSPGMPGSVGGPVLPVNDSRFGVGVEATAWFIPGFRDLAGYS